MKIFTLTLFAMVTMIANVHSQIQTTEKEKSKIDGEIVKPIHTNIQDKNNAADVDEDETDELSTTGCGGVERWDEKVLTDALANTVVFVPHHSTIAHLVAITTPTPGTSMPRYQPVEDSTYTITCNITIKKAELDSDFHLVLSNGTQTMIGEIPCTNCASVAASPYANLFQTCRNFI